MARHNLPSWASAPSLGRFWILPAADDRGQARLRRRVGVRNT
jgi:hypothetical protein